MVNHGRSMTDQTDSVWLLVSNYGANPCVYCVCLYVIRPASAVFTVLSLVVCYFFLAAAKL